MYGGGKSINIRYVRKENGGIHTAQNLAIRLSRGEYLTRIDSDDYLLPNALSLKDDCINKIPAELREKVAGVVGLCLNKNKGGIRGTLFPEDFQITTGVKLRKKGVDGDRNWCMKKDVLQKYYIPEYTETKWVPEGSALWLKLDKDYLTLFVNIPFSVCSEPNKSSVTGQFSKLTLSNVFSSYYGAVEKINYSKDIITLYDIFKSYLLINYKLIQAAKLDKSIVGRKRINENIINKKDRFFIKLIYPLAYCIYIYKH